MQYISVDDSIRIVVELGPGALIAKIDIASAYRLSLFIRLTAFYWA